MRRVWPAPRTSSGLSPSSMRLSASAGARFSQSGLGTVPNIAPPSSRIVPSESGTSSKSPNCTGPLDFLSELDEHAVSRGGMYEGHERAMRARTRRFVDQAHSAPLQLRQHGGLVIDLQRDVMKARSLLRQVLRDRRSLIGRLEKLERG